MIFFKKLFLGSIISTSIFFIIYFLIKNYNPDIDIDYILLQNIDYIIFLFLSIILIYISYISNSRFSKILIITTILINFVFLASFFSQNIIGLSPVEFSIIIIILALAILISYIKSFVRYIFMIIICIPFLIIIGNNTLPTYDQSPDFTGFYNNQTTKLLIISNDDPQTILDSQSSIYISDLGSTDNKQKFQIKPGKTTLNIDNKSDFSIFFSSKTGLYYTFAYILFPRGQIIKIHPQSSTDILTSDYQIKTHNTIGNIQTSDGTTNSGTSQDIQDIIKNYTNQKHQYLTDQIGGQYILNPTIDKFLRRYLNFTNSIYKLIPEFKFAGYEFHLDNLNQNILNYQEYHKHLPYQTKHNLGPTDQDNNMIINKTNEGFNQTQIQKRLK